MSHPFQDRQPNVGNNPLVRVPQRGAYQALVDYASDPNDAEREVGIVLPVGCGKSGTITLAPFAFRSHRTLVVAPGVAISNQLLADFNPSNPDMFYQKCHVLDGPPFPEPVEIRGTSTNRGDLDESHVVITNIQQLQGEGNPWLEKLPHDYFDLILFDEGHHSVAATWELLKDRFPEARIVNFSATPLRADGQLMSGRVLYSYPIFQAIQAGYVKRLKAVRLNPRTLRYVRRADGQELEVPLSEVIKLGEEEADFRRSIVTSSETLGSIVDASIRELQSLRSSANETRLKIIASALNYHHCVQIVEAYRARGMRADFVHSKADGAANKKVMAKLDAHELEVIVQVRKLGEGFDHKFLSVAAVFSVFGTLSPFVQFVGRVMRVVEQNAPESSKNRGVVVFHAGANIARTWTDFQRYSEADQEYFDQLLPLEDFDPSEAQRTGEPVPRGSAEMEVRAQTFVELEELPLVPENAQSAIRLLQQQGIIPSDFDPQRQVLQPVLMTKVAKRQAKRLSLAERVKTEAATILHARGVSPASKTLQPPRLNLVVMIAAINNQVNAAVGKASGQRHEFDRHELESIEARFAELLAAAEAEVFGGR